MSRKLHQHQIPQTQSFEFLTKDEFWLLSKSRRKAYNYFAILRGIEPYHKKDRDTDAFKTC